MRGRPTTNGALKRSLRAKIATDDEHGETLALVSSERLTAVHTFLVALSAQHQLAVLTLIYIFKSQHQSLAGLGARESEQISVRDGTTAHATSYPACRQPVDHLVYRNVGSLNVILFPVALFSPYTHYLSSDSN